MSGKGYDREYDLPRLKPEPGVVALADARSEKRRRRIPTEELLRREAERYQGDADAEDPLRPKEQDGAGMK